MTIRVPVSEAQGRLTELVRLVEAGDEVILTRHGQAAVRLVPVRTLTGQDERRRLLEAVRSAASRKAIQGPGAEKSQDFLYDDGGLRR